MDPWRRPGARRRAQALVSVATRFLVDIPDVQADVRDSLALHMAFAHLAVADASQRCGAARPSACPHGSARARPGVAPTCAPRGQVPGERAAVQLHHA